MKKCIVLLFICGLLTIFVTGCADVAESWSEAEIDREVGFPSSEQITETAAPMEEGYYVVEGRLSDMGKSELLLETKDGQTMCFKLSPETIIYAGENKEIAIGQNIKVVFDVNLSGEEVENISVIAVTLLEQEM